MAEADDRTMSDIRITPALAIAEDEIEERFILSSGPGGQNVNKVSSAVQLRFDAARSPSLPEPVRTRLLHLAGHRASKEGVITITAREARSQERNRATAREKLIALLKEAATPPKARRKSRPPASAKRARLETKKSRGALKALRGRPRETS
jgi:ribosome-associated protein